MRLLQSQSAHSVSFSALAEDRQRHFPGTFSLAVTVEWNAAVKWKSLEPIPVCDALLQVSAIHAQVRRFAEDF